MMMKSRRRSEAVTCFAERRQREHEAGRLHDCIPTLATLRLDIAESHGETNASPKYARIITVATSPALFALSCADPSCRDGGHDLTGYILRGLHDGKSHFEVNQRCYGTVGIVDCGRNMHVDVDRDVLGLARTSSASTLRRERSSCPSSVGSFWGCSRVHREQDRQQVRRGRRHRHRARHRRRVGRRFRLQPAR